MLTRLTIRAIAIVDELELDLAAGMTAITGETGAGKSIMVDALGLLLGDRAEPGVVRPGAGRAEIAATFDLAAQPRARAWLAGRDLDGDVEECHLRRVIGADGRSRGYINGSPQPLAALREAGELLVDIHGQHAHQSLLRREVQRQLLDEQAGVDALLGEVDAAFRHRAELARRLETLRRSGAEREERLELLRYQAGELRALGLEPGEVESLEEEHRRLAHAGQILAACQQALGWLYEGEEVSAQALLGHCAQELGALVDLDPALGETLELVDAALIQVREAGDALRRHASGLELDPARLEWVERRLGDIQDLARKHRSKPTALPGVLSALEAELAALEGGEQDLARLEAELAQAEAAYGKAAAALSARRREAALRLGEAVSTAMQGLGMGGGRLEVRVEPLERPAAHGTDAVEFLVSANPGQPLRPLARVASGGELSRISLAIQVLAAHGTGVPTLIFDEVDSGIGGGVAEMVGRQLRTLGGARQVLCVTHLPQVAAQAHHHLQVSKHTDGQTTRTGVTPLDHHRRVEEIARMLGGVELTDNTLAHAEEMVSAGQAR